MSLLFILNRIHTLFWCCNCWLWASKRRLWRKEINGNVGTNWVKATQYSRKITRDGLHSVLLHIISFGIRNLCFKFTMLSEHFFLVHSPRKINISRSSYPKISSNRPELICKNIISHNLWKNICTEVFFKEGCRTWLVVWRKACFCWHLFFWFNT